MVIMTKERERTERRNHSCECMRGAINKERERDEKPPDNTHAFIAIIKSIKY